LCFTLVISFRIVDFWLNKVALFVVLGLSLLMLLVELLQTFLSDPGLVIWQFLELVLLHRFLFHLNIARSLTSADETPAEMASGLPDGLSAYLRAIILFSMF